MTKGTRMMAPFPIRTRGHDLLHTKRGTLLIWRLSDPKYRVEARRFLFLPISYHHPRALAQRDLRLRPSPDGAPIGRDRRLEIIDSSDVLNDAVTGIIPDIDAESEVGLRLHGVAPPRGPCKAVGPPEYT
jgi:hypothetical protein